MSLNKILLATAITFGLCQTAMADEVFARKSLNLRAGPGSQYPIVEHVRSGSVLEVFGCLDGYRWCDVGYEDDRGWVYGDYLQTTYESRPAHIVQIGPQIDIPIITFETGSYWDHYYREKPFYHDEHKWVHGPVGHSEHVEVQHAPVHVEHEEHEEHYDEHGHEHEDHGNHYGEDHNDHGEHGHH